MLVSLYRSVWLFPLILLIILLGLTLLKISGSSVGVYEQLMHGPSYHDKNLLYGHPRSIRSDEFVVNTPLVISQVRSGFKTVSPLIGEGHNMSVVIDVPYWEWSELFKPQNWSFFVLPLENAFAFKWWFLGLGMVASCYLFLSTLLPGKKLFNTILSLSLLFAPFIQWWYQTITIAPIAYSFLILTLLVKLSQSETRRMKYVCVGLLSYVLVCFALVMYPPFQIPCLLAVAAFYIGYVAQSKPGIKNQLMTVRPAAIAAIIAVLLVSAFLFTRLPAIKAVTGTVYPGHRTVQSGGFSPSYFFSGPFLRNLQSDNKASLYGLNQSEASTFIMLWPMLLVPSGYIIYRRRREKKGTPYALVAVNVILLILAARLFVPMPGFASKIFLLDPIPHARLVIGMGLAGLLQMALLVKYRESTYPLWVIIVTPIVTFFVFLSTGFALNSQFPGYFTSSAKIVVPALLAGIILALFILNRVIASAIVLLFLNFMISHGVNPLYRGLNPITHSSLSTKIKDIAAEDTRSKWVFLDAGAYINYIVAQGVPSYSATYSYPELAIWERLDPHKVFEYSYDRYANVFFSVRSSNNIIYTTQSDSFTVRYNPCDQRFSGIDHVITRGTLESACLTKRDSVAGMPSLTIYDVIHLSQ